MTRLPQDVSSAMVTVKFAVYAVNGGLPSSGASSNNCKSCGKGSFSYGFRCSTCRAVHVENCDYCGSQNGYRLDVQLLLDLRSALVR